MNRAGDNLKALGSKTKYSMDYAPEVLETFENKHKENDLIFHKINLNLDDLFYNYSKMLVQNIFYFYQLLLK